ncbi:DUF7344 domain-containing protein [Natrialba asiatica]|uniref:DUF7344 domain-containing protein n=1 Tax=Natrialba asiatica (strain ATCC 700177 / DSM 12278 / JCM 9576 / FERM P-10747 / NBRC 102637 / 172P1) TaxID=29540 RepID=M0AU51_NATA1|nr:hypothetical protein [Natrialba asiatica]ELZ01867.1 hypothetical protein C481_10112 [Natrialba asiatica DSM 12278]
MLPVISDPESLTPLVGATADTDADIDILADRHRRAVLRYLVTHAPTERVSLADLADFVVLETDADDQRSGVLATTGDALFGTRKRVHSSLRHNHVPRLAEAGLVTFDPDANTVALREDGEAVAAELEQAGAERDVAEDEATIA